MNEHWRRCPPIAQDALLASLFAVVWFGGYTYLRNHGWQPLHADSFRLCGTWTSVVLLFRRTAPVPVLVATAIAYPVAYGISLQTEFHLLPILIAAYAATVAGRLRSLAVAVVAAAAVFVMSVQGQWVTERFEWDQILVNQFVLAATVVLGVLLHEQRRTAAELAERNQELERLRGIEAKQAIVDERTRIARELHDVAAHHLTAVIVRAQASGRVAEADAAEGAATLRWVVDTAREALTSMRQTVRVLRSDLESGGASMEPGPRLADLVAISERMQAVGLEVSLAVPPGLPNLDQQTELAVVRITQEALTNTIKHAHAKRAVVSLRASTGGVVLDIDDDGDGTAPVASEIRGHGLLGMRERATRCGGRLELGPSRLGGWRVRALLPNAGASAAIP